MQPNSNPDKKKYDYYEEKARYQKNLKAWHAKEATLPPVEMTEEDCRLAMGRFGPLYEALHESHERPPLFPPSPNSTLENVN